MPTPPRGVQVTTQATANATKGNLLLNTTATTIKTALLLRRFATSAAGEFSAKKSSASLGMGGLLSLQAPGSSSNILLLRSPGSVVILWSACSRLTTVTADNIDNQNAYKLEMSVILIFSMAVVLAVQVGLVPALS